MMRIFPYFHDVRVLEEHDGRCRRGIRRECWKKWMMLIEPAAQWRVPEITRVAQEYDENIRGIR